MKNIVNLFYSFLLIIAVSILAVQPGYGQKKDRVRMKMAYKKDRDAERSILITLNAGSGKSMHGVKNGLVSLSTTQGDSTIILAELATDTLGIARLYLEKGYKLPLNEDGIALITGNYDGDENYNSASNDLQIKDLDIVMMFDERDSVKYLAIKAKEFDSEGQKVPVEDLDVNIGVKRLFSVLPLGKVSTDADGWAELELPTDLPGDSTGNLVLVAQVDEHDVYGTVVNTASKEWGVPVSYEVKPLPRQLFTDEAPFWMIASVFIILLGAWYHFFLSVSKLIKLNKAG